MCIWCVYCGKMLTSQSHIILKILEKKEYSILLHMMHVHVHIILINKMNVCLEDNCFLRPCCRCFTINTPSSFACVSTKPDLLQPLQPSNSCQSLWSK